MDRIKWLQLIEVDIMVDCSNRVGLFFFFGDWDWIWAIFRESSQMLHDQLVASGWTVLKCCSWMFSVPNLIINNELIGIEWIESNGSN